MRVEDLERELRADRPEPDREFTRKLDDWAAAGFPRGELDPRAGSEKRAGDGFSGSFRTLWERLASTPPRRIIAPVAAAATIVVVGGVAITQNLDSGDDASSLGGANTTLTAPAETAQEPGRPSEAPTSGADAPSTAPETQLAVPSAPPAGGEAGVAADSIAPAPDVDEFAQPPDSGGGIARGSDDRLTDATARLSLGAEADDVQDVANDVVAVTDRHDGVVVNSQVTSDQAGARASFELEIPYAELDAAIADLSELGDVISRTEASEDVTPQANRAQRNLERTLEQIREAQEELIAADGREEKLILRSRIASLKAQANGFESQLNGVERQARFATVSVDVTSNGSESESDGWGLDDALEDAGDVLTAIAGVALVSLAVLVPLGLLAAIAYWFASRGRRARRESALDE